MTAVERHQARKLWIPATHRFSPPRLGQLCTLFICALRGHKWTDWTVDDYESLAGTTTVKTYQESRHYVHWSASSQKFHPLRASGVETSVLQARNAAHRAADEIQSAAIDLALEAGEYPMTRRPAMPDEPYAARTCNRNCGTVETRVPCTDCGEEYR